MNVLKFYDDELHGEVFLIRYDNSQLFTYRAKYVYIPDLELRSIRIKNILQKVRTRRNVAHNVMHHELLRAWAFHFYQLFEDEIQVISFLPRMKKNLLKRFRSIFAEIVAGKHVDRARRQGK